MRFIFDVELQREVLSNGFRTMLNILIKRGTDLNVRSDTGASALHYAITHKHGEMVRLLLDRSVDPESVG